MSKVRVQSFGLSLDGFGAGPRQSLQDPLGEKGTMLPAWFFPTQVFQSMHGEGGSGSTGVDNSVAAEGFRNIGAWIMGRDMFGPVRGDWGDLAWRGWWGDNPPYHVPVFVLTHHARQPLPMEGGTTFHFVTGGIQEALERAKDAASGKDVRIGGGATTIRQYLTAGLIDHMHLAYSPVLLGAGESLMGGLNLPELGYSVASHLQGENALHVFVEKTGDRRQAP